VAEPAISLDERQNSAESDAVERRDRSTIVFPYDDLNDATMVARAVHEYGGQCTTDQIAPRLGYSGVDNGSFRSRLSTARHFGLVTTSKDAVALTNLGREIVDPTTEARARAAAFLRVPLYDRVYADHRGYTLPPAAGLELKFVEYGVAPKQKERARQAFQRSAEQAGYFQQGRDRLVAPALPNVGQQPPAPPVDPAKDKGRGGGNGGDTMHPFIRGLVETLPQPGTPWSDAERDEWLTAAKSIFALIYKPSRLAIAGPIQPTPAEQATA
jgi:hypothetical protein